MADEQVNELETTWRQTDPGLVRSGTACKCGAHTSLYFKEGGAEWLAGHVAEVHPTAIDFPGKIREALAMEPTEALAFLSALIGGKTDA